MSISARVSSGAGARWRYVNRVWPARIRGHSSASGSFTFSTRSASPQTSSQLRMVAPDAS